MAQFSGLTLETTESIFIHSAVHLSNKYLLSPNYMPDTVLDI